MKLVKNRKGMTLVEVIVVLTIASILLVIMGSLILNAFGYFAKTTNQDLNKRSLDSLSSFVREELLYSSDVRVDKKIPEGDNWYSLYIKNGKLHQDRNIKDTIDGEQVFTSAFYNNKTLQGNVVGYGNYRLDLSFELRDEGDVVYQNKTTLELLNLKVKGDVDESFNPLSNIQNKATLVDATTKIYYQKVFQLKEEQPEEPEAPLVPDIGTVAQQMDCLTLHSNRREFILSAMYRTGDMVFHDGFWWLCMYPGDATYIHEYPGNSNMYWKKIDANFDMYSGYQRYDVVKHREKYYEAQLDVNPINSGGSIISAEPGSGLPLATKLWKEVNKPTASIQCGHLRIEANKDSVIYKIQNLVDQGKFTLKDIPLYKEKVNYPVVETAQKASDFVKIYDENLGGTFRYFKKMVEGHTNVAPGEKIGDGKPLVWQEIKVDWDPNSYYVAKDTVFYTKRMQVMGYIKLKENQSITKAGTVPSTAPTSPWEKKRVSNN